MTQTARALEARSLVEANDHGVLCTLSVKKRGYPLGSLTPYALDLLGRPIFFLSSLAQHTRNILEDPHASLMVADDEADDDLLNAGRVNLLGVVTPVPDDESEEARHYYMAAHPAAGQWGDFGDFQFYRLTVKDVYYICGFGDMGWVSAADFEAAGRR
jgi:putative heme iron utilization protein